MSNVSQNRKERKPVRRQRSIYQVHYCLQRREDDEMAKPLAQPSDPLQLQEYGPQVAGHRSSTDTKYLGLLQCNGKVLKPILKEAQQREVEFYSRLASATRPALVELRKFTPRYYGRRKFVYNGHEQDYIILEDLTDRMLEPCIMDVKIGRRTWDPLASPEKVQKERSKYGACKQQFAFCIPGYQVYRVRGGALHKYGKDCGKRLHGPAVVAAIRNFLNADGGERGAGGGGGSVCRALLLQLLGALWGVQRWAARQTVLRVYAASLLLVYDAARLRTCCHRRDLLTPAEAPCRVPRPPPARRRSIHSLHSPASGSFSGQLTATGPRYRKLPAGPPPTLPAAGPAPPPLASPWTEALERLDLSHSFDHNYEDKICKIKMNYRAQLDQLASDSPTPSPWGAVRLIDFAHAFFNDDGDETIDENFKEGIDNFVAIFETLLRETDDQVF